jgi:hypothetical protein
MYKVLIPTIPFGDKNRLPLEMLEELNIEYLINPLNKKLTEDELAEMVADFDVIIAGTEPITVRVMDRASNLKMISRVGIGLDSVDLLAAEERGIILRLLALSITLTVIGSVPAMMTSKSATISASSSSVSFLLRGLIRYSIFNSSSISKGRRFLSPKGIVGINTLYIILIALLHNELTII